ncbi:MAG: protein-glutamate O-methyltransferase CheR [Candidatus Velthaea sp.]
MLEGGAAALSSATAPLPPVTDLELGLLLEAVHRTSGFDFRDYAPAVLRRRVAERVRAEGAATISGLQERLLHQAGAMERFVDAVTYNASSPFREPAFFAAFREQVLPRLRTFPFARIWVAGCGSGDDAYALAILFRESNFAQRARIYATDATESAVERAKAGFLDPSELEEYERCYREAGGTRKFTDYLDTSGEVPMYRPSLRENVVFAQHNIATDGSFNEFHVVVVRHALAHFNRTLAYRAHQVVYESIVRLGYLGLGAAETLRYTPHQRAYEEVPGYPMFHRRIR